jgi:hypothetical protein
MKQRIARLLLVFWLPFLAAQQAAFAHWAGHLAAPVAAGMEPGHGKSGLAAADRLCAHCAAYAALDGLVFGNRTHSLPVAAPAGRVLPCLGQKSVSPIRRFDSRAPPFVL